MKIFSFVLILFTTLHLSAQVEIVFIPSVRGDQVTYIATGKNFNGMLGFQCSLQWDADSMTYRDLRFEKRFQQAQVNPAFASEGQLPMAWFTMQKDFPFADCDTIMTISFRSVQGRSKLSIGDKPVKTEFVNIGGPVGHSSSVAGNCAAGKGPSSGSIKLQSHPFFLEEGQSLTLRTNAQDAFEIKVYDLSGVLVKEEKVRNLQSLPAPSEKGIYLYQVAGENGIRQSGKIIIL